jgi:hypothetical protein
MLILDFGRRRVGKTTLARKQSLTAPTRVTFDPRKQFQLPGSVILDGKDMQLFWQRLDDSTDIVICPMGDVQGIFENVCDTLKLWTDTYPEESIAFLVDESYFIDTPGRTYESFDAMLRFSGSKQIKIIMTAHRPGDISVSIRSIADYLCIFRTTQEHDLKIIRERCGQEVVDLVARLRPRQYVLWDDGESTYRAMLEPSLWFVEFKGSEDVSPQKLNDDRFSNLEVDSDA